MQNGNCKVQSERDDLSERLLDFAAKIIKLAARLHKNELIEIVAKSVITAKGKRK
jgi:hypothetical protein